MTTQCSQNLQIGKAAEHLVVAELILQGYVAHLADAGSPYDIVVEVGGVLNKLQVKSTMRLRYLLKQGSIYRFGTRRGKGAGTRVLEADCNYFAFVALDIKAVGFMQCSQMLTPSGQVKQTLDLKSRLVDYAGRRYPNGTVRTCTGGKYIQDLSRFVP